MLMTKKPDTVSILGNMYNMNGGKINVLGNASASRLYSLLKFMKKNKLNITKDKILLVCHLFDNYKNIKLLEGDYNFDFEISKIRNKQLLLTFQQFISICVLGSVQIGFKFKEFTNTITSFFKNKKWLIIILFIVIISGILFYKYSYNYMKDEYTHNTSITRYIKTLKSMEDIYMYINDIKSVDTSCILYNAMLDKLNIDIISKYDNVDNYIKHRFTPIDITKLELLNPVDNQIENPIDNPVENPVENPVDNPVDNPVENPVDNPVDNPVENPVEHPVDNPVENPVEYPVENPVDNPVENPVDNPVEHPVEHPVDNPVENQVEHPVEHPVENPVDNQVEHPVDNPVEHPVDNPVEHPVEKSKEEEEKLEYKKIKKEKMAGKNRGRGKGKGSHVKE
jgi:hypothetical protein